MTIVYKRHLIDPKAYERPGGAGWGAETCVYREHGPYGTDSVFPVRGTFENKEKAIEAATAVAKQKIDEGYDDTIAVRDLAVPAEPSGV